LNGAIPYKNGSNEVVINKPGTSIRIEKKADGTYLYLKPGEDFTRMGSRVISSLDLKEAMVPEAIFENPDGTPVLFSSDYFNEKREAGRNRIGPFNNVSMGDNIIKLWPK
jgi:alpha-L-arabinofuranosidase